VTLVYDKNGRPYEDLQKEIDKLKEKHIKEIEHVKKEADVLMMKKIIKYEEQISRLKDDIDRLAEENNNIKIIKESNK
jgi:hypothetical protein|tara:strand:- start:245 stop:478 length:234 start_codon:yes stop_codon:yes gene_type:complete